MVRGCSGVPVGDEGTRGCSSSVMEGLLVVVRAVVPFDPCGHGCASRDCDKQTVDAADVSARKRCCVSGPLSVDQKGEGREKLSRLMPEH